MKRLLALFALILIPVAAVAADAPAEPKLYEDAWLKIKYYDVADMIKYDGDNKELLKIKLVLQDFKIKDGIILADDFETYEPRMKEKTKLGKYHVVLKIDKTPVKNHSGVSTFIKTAKPGIHSISYRSFTGGRIPSISIDANDSAFVLSEKPEDYEVKK